MKKHLLMSLAMVTIFGYFYLNFIGTLSQNVVPVSAEEKKVIRFFFPQGWGFFTRNPREAKYKLYQLEKEKAQLVNFEITSPKNSFGCSRKGNRISIEMIRVQHQLPKVDEWTISQLDIDAFAAQQDSFATVRMNSRDLLYIQPGKFIIQEYQITPWNWLNYPDNYTPEYKYFTFELTKNDTLLQQPLSAIH
ncbi:MAG: SdpA family antimicrobial peptide system protein [Bacteroidota bacterium]